MSIRHGYREHSKRCNSTERFCADEYDATSMENWNYNKIHQLYIHYLQFHANYTLTVFQLRMILFILVMYLLYIALWITLALCTEEEEPLNEETNEILYNYTKNLVINIKSNYQGTPFRRNGIWMGQKYGPPKRPILPPITLRPATLIPNVLEDNHRRPRTIRLVKIPKTPKHAFIRFRRSSAKKREHLRKAVRIRNLVHKPIFLRNRGLKFAWKHAPIIIGHLIEDLNSDFDLSMENKKLGNKIQDSKPRKTVFLNAHDRHLRKENYAEDDWSRRQYINRNKGKKFSFLKHDDDSDLTIRLNYGFTQPMYNTLRQKRFEIKKKSDVDGKDNLRLGKYKAH